MYNLRTTVQRKPTQKFTPSTYNQQKKKDAKLRKQKVKKEKENKI